MSKKRKEDLPWVDVVVDLLISLLSQNKSVLRQVGSSVFTMLCPHMTSTALGSIVDVVKTSKIEADDENDEDDDDEYEDIEEEEVIGDTLGKSSF